MRVRNLRAWVVNDGQRWTEQLDVRMTFAADAAMILSSPAPKAVFSVGLKVTIADLKSRPELNGCGGKIIGSFDVEKQRWPVKVIPKVGTHEELMLREANIAPRTHTPFATDDSVSVHSGSGAHSRNLDPQQVNGASHALPSDGILQFCDNPGCGKKLRESKRLNGLCRAANITIVTDEHAFDDVSSQLTSHLQDDISAKPVSRQQQQQLPASQPESSLESDFESRVVVSSHGSAHDLSSEEMSSDFSHFLPIGLLPSPSNAKERA